ncbi:unnamed protein product [Prunus armeniaca]
MFGLKFVKPQAHYKAEAYTSPLNPLGLRIMHRAMAATSFVAASLVRRAAVAFALSHPLINNRVSYHRTLVTFPLSPRLSSSGSGICHLAQAVKRDDDDLLKGVVDKTVIEEVKHVLEMARRASLRREVLHTNFLTPPVLKESMLALEKLADLKAVAQGGYPQAERCRISVGHPELLTSDPDIIVALSITGNFGFQPCSHGDFLGAILGTGIAREKFGDVIFQCCSCGPAIAGPCLFNVFVERGRRGLKSLLFQTLLTILYHHSTRLFKF